MNELDNSPLLIGIDPSESLNLLRYFGDYIGVASTDWAAIDRRSHATRSSHGHPRAFEDGPVRSSWLDTWTEALNRMDQRHQSGWSLLEHGPAEVAERKALVSSYSFVDLLGDDLHRLWNRCAGRAQRWWSADGGAKDAVLQDLYSSELLEMLRHYSKNAASPIDSHRQLVIILADDVVVRGLSSHTCLISSSAVRSPWLAWGLIHQFLVAPST